MAMVVTVMRTADRRTLCTCWERIDHGEEAERKGYLFQDLVLRAFELEGAQIVWPFEVRLDGQPVEQIDGVVYADGLSCLVESKCQEHRVNIEPIAKLRNQLTRRPSSAIGSVFSFSGFTEPVVRLAQILQPQTILLWEPAYTLDALRAGTMTDLLRRKLRWAVERGLPDYDPRREEVT